METGQEVLLQEGHYKETHALAFQVLRDGRTDGRTDGRWMMALPPSLARSLASIACLRCAALCCAHRYHPPPHPSLALSLPLLCMYI